MRARCDARSWQREVGWNVQDVPPCGSFILGKAVIRGASANSKEKLPFLFENWKADKMKLPAEVKPALWGVAGGAVAAIAIGFIWAADLRARCRPSLGHRRQGGQGRSHDPERDAVEWRQSGDQQGVAAGLSVPPSKPLGRNLRAPAGSRFFVRAVSRLRVVSQFEILTALARVGGACYA